MLDNLRDLVRHTTGLGVETLKLTGTEGNVVIEGVDTDKSIVIKGEFKQEIPELEGICGLSKLDHLSGIVRAYNKKEDTVLVSRSTKMMKMDKRDADGKLITDENGNAVSVEEEVDHISQLTFKRKSPAMKNDYRVIDRRMIPDQYSMASAVNWDVVIEPNQTSIELLQQQASIGIDQYFGVKTREVEGVNTLFVTLGEAGSEAELEFATDIEGNMTRDWIWSLDTVLKILKMADSAICTMSFLDKGALQITLDTGLAEYNYIMPSRSR